MFDFGIFCHLRRLMGIYWVRAPVWVLKSFVLSFSFLHFLFDFLFYSSFVCLSLSLGGPFSSGAPGHCPTMPPSAYATGCKSTKQTWNLFCSLPFCGKENRLTIIIFQRFHYFCYMRCISFATSPYTCIELVSQTRFWYFSWSFWWPSHVLQTWFPY